MQHNRILNREREHGSYHANSRDRQRDLDKSKILTNKVKDLESKCDRMAREMVHRMPSKRSVMDELFQNTILPITEHITNFPLPKKFKVPHMLLFDGNNGLIEHLETYRAHFESSWDP